MVFDTDTRSLTQRSSTLSSLNERSSFVSSRNKDYGNSLNRAENIGTLKASTNYRYSGDVGGRDLDFFKFKTKEQNNLTLDLANLNGNDQPIAISLLNKSGNPIKNGGKFVFKNVEVGNVERLSITGLAKGTYYLRLQSANGRNENYNLRLFATRSPLSTARNLGDLDLGETISSSGFVGNTDIDYYKFATDRTSRVVGRFFNDSSDQPIAFTVLDKNGTPIRTGNGSLLFVNVNANSSNSLLDPTLPKGTYYLRAQSAQGSSEPYRFRLTRTNDTTPV